MGASGRSGGVTSSLSVALAAFESEPWTVKRNNRG